jgi:RNA polymerase sigma-70 factor (ECF subfamily)
LVDADAESKDEDWELLKRSTPDDMSGYETLVERYWQSALAFTWQIVGDHHRAEDVVQKGFVNVFLAKDRIEDRARFRTFFFKILLNLSINELHKKKSPVPLSSVVESDDTPVESLFADAASPDPTKPLESRECMDMIKRAVMALPPKYRAALYLREYMGMAYSDIATTLDASLNEVKIWLFRGRTKMQELLKPYLERGEPIR